MRSGSTVDIRASVLVLGVVAMCAWGPAGALARALERDHTGVMRSAERKMTQGWAWQAQRAGAPNVGPASGVPEKDLAVAWLGQRDKLTYLGIHGRGLTGALLQLEVDGDANNLNVPDAELRGCLILHEWRPARPMPWDQKPVTGCDKEALGLYQESTNSFVFDLTPLARSLTTRATYGVSIEPVEEPKSNFQTVFKGGDSVVVRKSSGGGGGGGGGPSFVAPDGTVGSSGGDVGSSNTNANAPPIGFDSAPVPAPNGGPAFDAGDPGADVAAPVAVPDAAPSGAEGDPPTFAWVYLALVAVAVFPIITRVLAYSLPARRTKGKRR